MRCSAGGSGRFMTQFSRRAATVLVAAALTLSACSTEPAADPTSTGLVPLTVSPSVVTTSGSGSSAKAATSGSSQPLAPTSKTTVSSVPTTATTNPSPTAPSTTPSTTRPPATTPTTPPSPEPPSTKPSPSTSRITAGGIPAADRTEIAKVWALYWKVLDDAGTRRAGDFSKRAAEVATGREYQGLVDTDINFRKNGIANFGSFTSRISWGPLSGDEAVIRDCMDQSEYGTYDTSNNKAITIGSLRVNLNATFKRVKAGWRVAAIYEPPGEAC